MIGTPCDIHKYVDSTGRRYAPSGAPKLLSSLKFVEDGLNLCILGASDSGKTYLAKALGTAACEKYLVSYKRCDEFLSGLVDLKQSDYPKYERTIRKVLNFHLLIIDDFPLNTVTDERQIKVLRKVLEKRIELARSTIVCSQREPDTWQAMVMNDAVSADAISKRVTKHYTIMIKCKENPASVTTALRKMKNSARLIFSSLNGLPLVRHSASLSFRTRATELCSSFPLFNKTTSMLLLRRLCLLLPASVGTWMLSLWWFLFDSSCFLRG